MAGAYHGLFNSEIITVSGLSDSRLSFRLNLARLISWKHEGGFRVALRRNTFVILCEMCSAGVRRNLIRAAS